MSTDRELLEAAAKAAGLPAKWMPAKPGVRAMFWHANHGEWSPLTDDGDALRLAVKLRMTVDCCGTHIEASIIDRNMVRRVSAEEYREPDQAAATRRAIVRAAAAIGGLP